MRFAFFFLMLAVMTVYVSANCGTPKPCRQCGGGGTKPSGGGGTKPSGGGGTKPSGGGGGTQSGGGVIPSNVGDRNSITNLDASNDGSAGLLKATALANKSPQSTIVSGDSDNNTITHRQAVVDISDARILNDLHIGVI
ncbi:uncharacterized protein LOC130672268 [Microplitis mediator]|uniref:uncharacterized protein LOC130672268 n=1 Tax=Microplitis mediator TaxID=375433 RepID=UPI0025539DC8|nr:uncharacterized protein LOC130672268 [Microplitis mediator]